MKNVIKEFEEASPLSKLATFADIATILGVSVATFVAGPFLSEVTGVGFSGPEFIVAILVYSIFVMILVGIFLVLWNGIKLYRLNSETSTGDGIVYTFTFLILIAIYASVMSPLKGFIGDITNNRYLLPLSAARAVNNIENITIEKIGEKYAIKGTVSFNKDINPLNYISAFYMLDQKEGLYILHSVKNSESFEINSNGGFVIPGIDSQEQLKEGRLVIFREKDSQFGVYDFPNNLSIVPNNELSQIEVYSFPIKN
ncbi:hypothetical protein [Pseudoalteromonas aliena]|uniref:Uncharacterized protein n=1 Tax=Pseudoalteromonas aliena SW19 TaxID=1314866 RepID=A0ABR9DXR4_9GAMM|nr:hypothetical protein [Pseudoalteromonas aliena]MBE0359146.1 hypothetical protein [Pseudoalteromonas aliena SW19]